MITKAQITQFYKQGPIAIIGVSRQKKKFGYMAYTELRNKGISVIPVNPQATEIDGEKCYNSIGSLPDDVKNAVVITKKTTTLDVVKQLLEKGITNIWIQQGSDTREALDMARQQNANLIHGKCIIMFSEPLAGFHKFHRSLVKLFGGMPK